MNKINEIVNNMYESNIEEIKQTVIKNKNYGVKVNKSSIYMDIEHLLETSLIDKCKEHIDLDDLEIIQHTLFTYDGYHDIVFEKLEEKHGKPLLFVLAEIKEDIIKEYLENKLWIKEEINEIKENYNEEDDQTWFIVYNINNKEFAITDDQNVGRYGSPEELLTWFI